MMTDGLTARIDLKTFPKLPIFDLIQRKGNIPERDMYNTFNMGLGMILAIPAVQADAGSLHSDGCGRECLSGRLCGLWQRRCGVSQMKNIAVLVSGGGTNLQALIDAQGGVS